MSILSKQPTKNEQTKALYNACSNIANKLKIPFKEIMSSIMLVSVLSGTANADMERTIIDYENKNVSKLEAYFNHLGLIENDTLEKTVSVTNKENIIIVLDENKKQFSLQDKYGINTAQKYSHMEMVNSIIGYEENSYYSPLVINVDVIGEDFDYLNTALKDIEKVVKENPNKNFIINASLGEGNTNYQDQMINLALNNKNIKIIKSMGNADNNAILSNFALKNVKEEKRKEFFAFLKNYFEKEKLPQFDNMYSADKETREKLKKFKQELSIFIKEESLKEMNDLLLINNYHEYKEAYQKEEKLFSEAKEFSKKLHKIYMSDDYSIEQKEQLNANLKIVKAYGPKDFIQHMENMESMKGNKEAQIIYEKISKIAFKDGKFQEEQYKKSFILGAKKEHQEIEKLLQDFIFKYQKTNPEYFEMGHTNEVAQGINSLNMEYAMTDVMREIIINKKLYYLLANGTSTAAPVLTKYMAQDQQEQLKHQKYANNTKKANIVPTA